MKAIETVLKPKNMNYINEFTPDQQGILFSAGLGINPLPEIPVRLLAYLLPVIALVREYKQSKGQFYMADKAALRIGQDPKTVQRNVILMADFLRFFIRYYDESISESIVISQEKSDTGSSAEKRAVFIKELTDVLLRTRDKTILNFANNRRREGQDITVPLGYMAEHALFARDPVTKDSSLFLVDNPKDYPINTLVIVGGPAEEIFYRARKIVVEAFAGNGQLTNGFKRIQIFSGIGRIPPYYSRFGEPTVEGGIPPESVKAFLSGLNAEIRTDYLTLLIALSDDRDFSLVTRKNNLIESDYESLQSGLDRLIYFINQFRNEQKSILAGR